mgnify:CR=1 FL=1
MKQRENDEKLITKVKLAFQNEHIDTPKKEATWKSIQNRLEQEHVNEKRNKRKRYGIIATAVVVTFLIICLIGLPVGCNRIIETWSIKGPAF